MRGEMISEYQKLNSEDQKAFRHFLWVTHFGGYRIDIGGRIDCACRERPR